MAVQTETIKLTWENGVNFKMSCKRDEGLAMTIISADEDGSLAKLWDSGIRSVCLKFFEGKLDAIGTEMKA